MRQGRAEKSDKVQDLTSKQPIIANVTCWSSWPTTVKRVVEVQDKKRQVCTELNLLKLIEIEFEFLDDYEKVIGPVTRALNILQGDENCFLEMLLPMLIAQREKMIETKQNCSIKYTKALVEEMLNALEARFDHTFTV